MSQNIQELKVHCSVKGCTCMIMLQYHISGVKWFQYDDNNNLSQSCLGQYIVQQNLSLWQAYLNIF